MTPNNQLPKRLLSVDILRGLTVAGMILVNNGYGDSFATLQHSKWNGLTLCDLVFPFFLFIVGVSCFLSLSKTNFEPSRNALRRILKRTLTLFLIGIVLNLLHNILKENIPDFEHLRIWGVMQRIALCYLAVSLFAIFVNHRYTVPVVCIILTAYALLLLWGNGYAQDAEVNILAIADRTIFGYDHLYHKSPVDPEGLLGTLPSIAHVLLGFYCGKILKQTPTVEGKIKRLAIAGTVFTVVGLALSIVLPVNKRVWSPSYTLITCGLACLLLVLLMMMIDYYQGEKRLKNNLLTLFRVFGVNALALYVSSEVLAMLFSRFGVNDALYAAIHQVVLPYKWASLLYSLSFVFINYVIGYILYVKKIYIKL